jgi:membrane associated rhomboid family serine protease
MMRLTDVVKSLIILNVVIYFAAVVLFPQFGDWLPFHYPRIITREGTSFQPFQIITHMFMHGGITHLLFNMVGLFFFGPPLESLWGPKKFLFYYFFAGLGALGLNVFVNFIQNDPSIMLGASGAIMGLLIGFAYNFPQQKVSLIFPPITLTAKQMVIAVIAIDLGLGLFGNRIAEDGTGIAHFAHLGGALFVFILLQYWNKFGSRL